jgi:hypothetical protein
MVVMDAFRATVEHFVSILAALDWMQWILLWALAFLVFVLWRCQIADDAFDLRHLIVNSDSGKIDRFAFGYLVGLVVLSWITLAYSMAGKLTEWLAGLYMVYCAAPKSVEVWINAKKPAP